MWMPSPAFIADLSPKNWLELFLLFIALYLFLRFLRRTIAGGIFKGPAMLSWVVILGIFLLLREVELDVLNSILSTAFPVFIIALVVTFQMELRHGIARLGNVGFLRKIIGSRTARPEQMKPVDEIIRACRQFAERRVGALIAVERNIDLGTYMDTGVPMDAIIRAETLDTIFSTHTVLHDGALLIRGDRIAAAGCLLPLTERPQLARDYGTRHRAAIGLSEQSDAVVLVVSEERGDVHKAERGEMEEVTDWEWLRAYLSIVFAEKTGLVPRELE
ncbi:MAG: diadenylate cyclase CdaA [Planctomycetota bacterium]|nr:diadenylate cyclase CdaA [Planctomycetota bacterium]